VKAIDEINNLDLAMEKDIEAIRQKFANEKKLIEEAISRKRKK